MTAVRQGDTVRVHYTGKLADGTVFDSSAGREPLEFTVGERRVISGFENAVVGLGVGEQKKVSIPPEDGYGEYTTDLVATIDRSKIPADVEPAPGLVLQANTPDGPMKFMITVVDGDNVTLDGNHPLAGKRLEFDIEVMEIVHP